LSLIESSNWGLSECIFFINSGKKKYRKEAIKRLEELEWNENESEIVEQFEVILKRGVEEDQLLCLMVLCEKNCLSVDLELLSFLIENNKNYQIKKSANLLLQQITAQKKYLKIKKVSKSKKPKTLIRQSVSCDIEVVWTEQQEEALLKLSRFLKENIEKVFVLSGYAGTGKSTLCSEILKRFQEKKFMLTASTNKAVSVLSEMSSRSGVNNSCVTIHKFLNLVPSSKVYGGFLQQTRRPEMKGVEVVVVDECSMVNDELMYYIDQVVANNDIQMIFMGDPMQLPPVNEKMSRTFENQNGYQLSQIVRQAAGNPIIEMTMKIRESIENNDFNLESVLDSTKNCDKLQICESEKKWFSEINKKFNTKPQKKKYCILTWSNKRVAKLNLQVEALKRDVEKCPFENLQQVLVRKPIFQYFGDKIMKCLIQTDSICIVVKSKLLKVNDLNVWYLKIKNTLGVSAEVFHAEASVLSNLEENSEILKEMRIKTENKLFSVERMVNSFNSIQYLHAMTVHRSQGTTYDGVFVDLPKIFENSNTIEAYKMLYVALTRSKEKVIMWK